MPGECRTSWGVPQALGPEEGGALTTCCIYPQLGGHAVWLRVPGEQLVVSLPFRE